MNGYIFEKPYIWLTVSWPSVALLNVFNTGDWALLSIFSAILFLPTFIAWLVMMIRALILRRLRYFVLITTSGVFALSISYLCLRFSDEIHFRVMRPIYLRQINSASKEVDEKQWDWGGAFSSEGYLLYLRNPTPSSLSFAKDNPGCIITIKKMSAHFFATDFFC